MVPLFDAEQSMIEAVIFDAQAVLRERRRLHEQSLKKVINLLQSSLFADVCTEIIADYHCRFQTGVVEERFTRKGRWVTGNGSPESRLNRFHQHQQRSAFERCHL